MLQQRQRREVERRAAEQCERREELEALILAALLRSRKPPDQIWRLLFGELSLVRLTRAG